MSNTPWHKNINDSYSFIDDKITFKDFLENLKSTESLKIKKSDNDKPIIYIPTHNIHDAYEWFRLFKDSHIYDNIPYNKNFDKYGFWIHGYFDKNMSQSINTYFPNLYLVKATSSDKYKFDGVVRSSIDYINTSDFFERLFIDEVEVFNNEKILLKNQFIDTLETDIINPTISTNNSIYIPYTTGLENYYKANGILRLNHVSGWLERNIINVTISTIIAPNDYLKIDIDDNIDDINLVSNIADSTNGLYVKTSFETENGIYTYINNMLVRMPEMDDKYKTYNQIVYTYQGLTNENNEYYLRRIEDQLDNNYSLYPFDSLLLPFIYSKGEAYLIKCEFDYSLDINTPLHPETIPFNITGQENCYRMLFMDKDIAKKIMLKDNNGVGTYDNTVNNTILDLSNGIDAFYNKTPLEQIRFFTTGGINRTTKNAIHNYLNEGRFIGYPLNSGSQTIYNIINPTESSIPTQLTYIEFVNIIYPSSGTANTLYYGPSEPVNYYTNLIDTTRIKLALDTYRNIFDIKSIVPGYLINIKIEIDKDGTGLKTIVHDNFMITNVDSITERFADFNVYPKFDNQIIEILDVLSTYNNFSITYDVVNTYGKYNPSLLFKPDLDLPLLEQAINKTELKNMYELVYETDINKYCVFASTDNIPGLLISDAGILLSALDGAIDSISLFPGNLVLIKNQINQSENGIYVYNGLGRTLVRYTDIDLLLTDNYIIINGAINVNKIYQPSYILLPTETKPNFGTTIITFIINNANITNRLIINNAKQHYSKKWLYYGFYYELVNIAEFGDFYNYYDQPTNVNNNIVNINSIYGNDYQFNNYLSEYLNLQYNINDIETTMYSTFIISYNPTGTNDLLYFDKNIVRFGSDYNAYFLDNIKKHMFIMFFPNLTGTPVIETFVHDIKWFDDKDYGEMIIDHIIELSEIPSLGTLMLFKNKYNSIKKIDNVVKLTDKSKFDQFQDFNSILGTNTTLNNNLRPNTDAYAYALMNPLYDSDNDIPNSELLENLTAIWFKEEAQSRVSFRKRDKNFIFPNYYNVVLASTGNITITGPTSLQVPTNTDGYNPNIGDLILLRAQTINIENGIWYYNGIDNPLLPCYNIKQYNYYYVDNGASLINKVYKLIASSVPIEIGVTIVNFIEEPYKLKSDSRLYLRPVEIAKLGVNNDTQPWQKINYKYDILELEENLVNIEIGINNKRRIRFIDGLTENNILKNINGQGQYDWILNDDVIVEDAVVGCTKDFGPGTGTLIWYTGKWINGTWIDGIWIQGEWYDGVWTNGTFKSISIQDFYYNVNIGSVADNNLSLWHSGTWLNGTWEDGTWEDGTWHNGIHNNGIWKDGLWINGTWNCGIWQSGKWINGVWNGGDFETGEWMSGIFDQLNTLCPSRFGTKAKTNTTTLTIINRAIWHSGTFKDGEVWSGSTLISGNLTPNLDDQRATVFFSVNFQFGTWKSGTCVLASWQNGVWQNGVWLGGYNTQFTNNNTSLSKELTIDTYQYHSILALPLSLVIYHNANLIGETQLYLTGRLTDANIATQTASVNITMWNYLLYNMFETNIGGTYQPKYIDTNYIVSANTINILSDAIGNVTTPAPLFITENSLIGDLDMSPFICSIWHNGTFTNGIWLNGWWKNGIWKTGYQRTGIFMSGILGVDTE